MKLPNADRAIVRIEKLRDYALDTAHPRGRHKARVFAAALDLRADDAENLREALLCAARSEEATLVAEDEYGSRYAVDFPMQKGDAQARVRSVWLVKPQDGIPRFISCYVMKKKR